MAISPFELLQEDVQIHAFLGINERDLESKLEKADSHESHGTVVIHLNTRVDLAHLFGHLLDGSGDFLVLVLGHRQTEELLDAAVVRLPRRRLLLDGRPQGLTVCVCTWGKKMAEIIQM